MKKEKRMFCKGEQCSVKNTCLRYTRGKGVTMFHGRTDVFIRKCTLQKCYLQDESNINQDSKRH